jgi:hypothetical protein
MKLIIDIDEKSRECLFDIANNGLDISMGLENIMIMAIVNGTSLPEGAEILSKEEYSDLCMRAAEGSDKE